MAAIFGKEKIRKYYQTPSVAKSYFAERFETPLALALHKNQIRLIGSAALKFGPKSILEIAPGPGRITTEVAFGGIAIESSKAMIERLKENLSRSDRSNKWEVRRGNAFKTGMAKCSVDAVVTFRFIRHFDDNDRRRLYAEFGRIIKPGGYLIFDVPNETTERTIRERNKGKYPVYDKLWSKHEFVREMKENGFSVVSMKGNIKFFYLQTVISKLLFWLPNVPSLVIRALERIPVETANPFEWVAVCKKI